MLTKDILWDFADGLLSEEQHNAIERELVNHPDGQKMLADIVAQKQQWAKLPLAISDTDFASSVLALWQKEQIERQVEVPQSNVMRYIFFTLLGLTISLLYITYNITTEMKGNENIFELPNVDFTMAWINPLSMLGTAILFVKFIESMFRFYSFRMNYSDTSV